MTMNRRILLWRRLIEALQGLVILGLPFLRIRGESALRFDIPTLRLHFFGVGLWMEEFFLVLIALIFFIFLVILITLLFGRVWCGWACPQTVIIDYTHFVDRRKKVAGIGLVPAYAATFVVSVIVGANLIWYFVSPYEFFGRLFYQSLGSVIWGFWIVLTTILFLNLAFVRHRFCATVCPYAKLQSVLYDSGTLLIAFDPRRKNECTNCMACVRTCPVGIDIRQGQNAACINCAECIDECTNTMARRGRKTLVGYFFGLPGEGGRILRQSVALIGSLSVASFGFLLYLSFSRVLLDMTVLPNYDFAPRMSDRGTAVNSYLLSIENRGSDDLELAVKVSAKVNGVEIVPKNVSVKAGQYRRIPVYVSLGRSTAMGKAVSIEISLEAPGSNGIEVVRKAHFMVPEG